MGGRGSLSGMMPYGDANAIVMDMAREVIPVVQHTPVLGRRLRHRSLSRDEVCSCAKWSRPGFRACRIFRPWD